MRVATKITTLTSVLIAVLALGLAFDVWWIQRLAKVTHSLTTTTFRVGSFNFELGRELAQLDEFSRKAEVSGADYLEVLASSRLSAARLLRELSAIELSPAERDVVSRLHLSWRRYRLLPPLLAARTVESTTEITPAEIPQTAEPSPLPAHRLALAELASQLEQLSFASERQLRRRKRDASRAVSATKRVAGLAVGGTLLLALPLLWWTIRSIHRPLRRLTAGTRDVAAGRFIIELDASSGDELAEVAASFNQMVRHLRQVDELKRDFLSHVSHELNTPLVAMRETNELLLDRLAGPLTDKQQRMLELNRDGAVRLSTMIRKVLDLARLEAGAMEYDFAPLDLRDLVRTVCDEFSAAALERKVELAIDLPPQAVMARGDRDRLLQVLENLLSNALKFAPAESTVRIALSAPTTSTGWRRGRSGGSAVMTVSDEGPGVAADQRQRIFEKFHRGSRQGSHGFGLGLAISREIVDAHGGQLWVREATPQGSVFGVELAAIATPQTDGLSASPLERTAMVLLLAALTLGGCALRRANLIFEEGDCAASINAYEDYLASRGEISAEDAPVLMKLAVTHADPKCHRQSTDRSAHYLRLLVDLFPRTTEASEARLMLTAVAAERTAEHLRHELEIKDAQLTSVNAVLRLIAETERSLRSEVENKDQARADLENRLAALTRQARLLNEQVASLQTELEALKQIDLESVEPEGSNPP